MSHFRIFEITTYCHVPSEKRKKLEMTTERGYLVGYIENAKAYHIYVPESKKVVVQRDVKFMEEKAFRRSRELPSATQREDN